MSTSIPRCYPLLISMLQGDGDRQQRTRPFGRSASISRPVHDEVAVVVATVEPPPEQLGVTHWSSWLLAEYLGMAFATVAHILAQVEAAALADRDVQVLHRARGVAAAR